MQLVGIAVVAVITYLREERSIVVERPCQLVGVSPVDIRSAGVIPLESPIAIERVASSDDKVGILLLELACYLLLISLAALLPIGEVGFVERRDAQHAVLRIVFLDVLDIRRDHRHPVVDIRIARSSVPLIDACLLIGIQDDVAGIAHDVDGLHAISQRTDLAAGQRRIARERSIRAEAAAHQRQVLLADMVDALAHVLAVVPGNVHSPAYRELHSLVANAERYDDIAVGNRGKILARRRAIVLRHSCSSCEQENDCEGL